MGVDHTLVILTRDSLVFNVRRLIQRIAGGAQRLERIATEIQNVKRLR
jgi:hypothetical protein